MKKKYSTEPNAAWQQRKRGEITRHMHSPTKLSMNQRKFAEDLADRYGIDYNLVATYLDWYAAVHYKWITPSQAEVETGRRIF